MVNTHHAISGMLGVKLDEDVATADNNHSVGTTVKGNNASEWLRVRTGSTAITQYDCVAVESGGTASPITHALARAGNTIGVAQVAIAANHFGWVAINGHSLIVGTLAAEAVGVTLYTTDTAGKVADATASGSAATLMGLTLVATASGTTASNAACILQNPVARKTIVDA
jgi:hypothetical protein